MRAALDVVCRSSFAVLLICALGVASLARATPAPVPPARESAARRATGYAILIAAMVASAAVTSSLSAALPKHAQFLSYFISQVSTLGVYVFGAPIWEPLGSGFRKMAFGVEGEAGGGDDALETMWRRTQHAYSLNEQMSRNVITSFLTSVRQNFYEAHRAATAHDPVYAVDQLAEAAVRLRRHFADISPRDESVAAAIRAAFTNSVTVDLAFRQRWRDAIDRLDPAAAGEDRAYYDDLTDAWFGPLEKDLSNPRAAG